MKTIFTNTVWKYLLGVLFVSLGFNVNAQSVAINPTGPILCAGTKLDAVITNLNPPYTYQWNNGATTASIVVTQTGFYRVRVRGFNTQGNPRSVNSPWVPIFVIPLTNAGINANGPTTLCPGQTVQLQATGGQFFSSYEWSTGATTRNITVGTTGDYTISVTNSFGGCNSSTTATVHVEVYDANFHPTITALSPITVCKPGYVSLTTDSGFSGYQWSTGATTQSVNVLMDGLQLGPVLDTLTVHLTVMVNNQCEFTDTAGIVLRSVREPKLGTAYCGNTSLTATDSIKSEVVLTYLTSAPEYDFEFEDTQAPGTTWNFTSSTRWCNLANLSTAVLAGHFYNVRVRAVIDGTPYCYGAPCTIGIAPNRSNVNVAQTLRIDGSALTASVNPNPSADAFKLVVSNLINDMPAVVRISDISGRLVNEYTYDSNSGSLQFGQELTNGVYFVSVEQGDAKSITRIIKSN